MVIAGLLAVLVIILLLSRSPDERAAVHHMGSVAASKTDVLPKYLHNLILIFPTPHNQK